jgi:hypothetical protein
LAAETGNGPSFIAMGAIAQGYQTAPERTGKGPSERSFGAWMPAARVAVTGNINPNIIEATVQDRAAHS